MKHPSPVSVLALAALAVLLLQGCDTAKAPPPAAPDANPPAPAPATLTVEGATYRITGPHNHENLAVYVLHSDTQDSREFITLDEGLKSGEVKVTEKKNEQVNELLLENNSAKSLFVHEGDRVRGGKQDRTIFTSFVVAPKSGPQPLPSFCIEHNRWTEGAGGGKFDATSNGALAPKEVRAAAKVGKDQSQVWENVAQQKAAASANLSAPNTNSSLNETLDAPKVKAISDACAKALAPAIETPADAVGIAIVINGKVEEVDIYPNHSVLTKISPRLLESYAISAVQVRKQAVATAPLQAKDIAAFVASGQEKSKREEKIDTDNSLKVSNFDNAKSTCTTKYNGQVVHVQALSNVDAKAQSASARAPGNETQEVRQQRERPSQAVPAQQ